MESILVLISKINEKAVVFLMAFLLTGCVAQPQSTTNQRLLENYPKKIALTKLGDELNTEYGFEVIGDLNELQGSFCWVGLREPIRLESSNNRVSILQRVIVKNGNVSNAANFQFPLYNPALVSGIYYPIFARSNNSCYVRVLKSISDVGAYQLYSLDLSASSGVLQEKELFLTKRLSIAPNGTSYAFEQAEPYSNANYALIASVNGSKKIVSESRYTVDFSWSHKNTLLYSDISRSSSDKREYGYPDIYENNLEGEVKRIARNASRPLMSPDEKYLALIAPDIDSKNLPHDTSDYKFDFYQMRRATLAVFDRNEKRKTVIKKVYEKHPSLFWSRDSKQLYIIENNYIFSEKTAICRISIYEAATGSLKVLCELTQAGQANSYEDGNLLPYFIPLGIANDKNFLLHVAVSKIDGYRHHVLAVSLENGKRRDILTFTAPLNTYNLPLVDWYSGA